MLPSSADAHISSLGYLWWQATRKTLSTLKAMQEKNLCSQANYFSLIKGSPSPLQQISKNIKKDRRVKNRFKLIDQVNLYSNFIFQLSVSQTFGGVFTLKIIINATW